MSGARGHGPAPPLQLASETIAAHFLGPVVWDRLELAWVDRRGNSLGGAAGAARRVDLSPGAHVPQLARRPDAAETSERVTKTEADLIESLPFEVPRPQSDLLAEAKRLYEQGAYAQAIVYLFSYQLVQLDQHQAIRLTRGKTNRQYLRELLARPDLGGILERTMVAFEDVFFGHHPLDRAGFERCWQRLDEFHQRISEAAP